jgi:hypothetical protein
MNGACVFTGQGQYFIYRVGMNNGFSIESGVGAM